MDEAVSDRLQLRYAQAEEGKNRGHEGVCPNYNIADILAAVMFVTPQCVRHSSVLYCA